MQERVQYLSFFWDFTKPQSGEVLINGIHADTITDKDKRKLFAYVEQTFHMVAGTVKEQITLFDDSISDEDVKISVLQQGLMMR